MLYDLLSLFRAAARIWHLGGTPLSPCVLTIDADDTGQITHVTRAGVLCYCVLHRTHASALRRER
jgi:hypothetical protein